eukprot:TRINITY_DN20695_c0_g1_i1.p1 TRINITY_DN20695_c0_g1~~TRINITY_DN20695_c0_g1_i1.p1  ORF type:complete len:410 (+),score=106.21 TRINITY_DN20695_c0_g1_i1:81-1310(+)
MASATLKAKFVRCAAMLCTLGVLFVLSRSSLDQRTSFYARVRARAAEATGAEEGNEAKEEEGNEAKGAESAVDAERAQVLRDWAGCALFHFVHISKAGGTTFNRCIAAQQLRTPPKIVGNFRNAGTLPRYLSSITLCSGVANEGPIHEGSEDDGQRQHHNNSAPCALEEGCVCAPERQLITSAEAFYSQVQQFNKNNAQRAWTSYFEPNSCVVALVRDPHTWMRSAYAWLQGKKWMRKYKGTPRRDISDNYHFWSTTDNVQTAFVAHVDLPVHSFTLVALEHIDTLLELFGLHMQSVGGEREGDGPGAEVAECQSHLNTNPKSAAAAHKTDWGEWVARHNPLDVDLHALALRGPAPFFHVSMHEERTKPPSARSNAYTAFRSITSQFVTRPLNRTRFSITDYVLEHSKP